MLTIVVSLACRASALRFVAPEALLALYKTTVAALQLLMERGTLAPAELWPIPHLICTAILAPQRCGGIIAPSAADMATFAAATRLAQRQHVEVSGTAETAAADRDAILSDIGGHCKNIDVCRPCNAYAWLHPELVHCTAAVHNFYCGLLIPFIDDARISAIRMETSLLLPHAKAMAYLGNRAGYCLTASVMLVQFVCSATTGAMETVLLGPVANQQQAAAMIGAAVAASPEALTDHVANTATCIAAQPPEACACGDAFWDIIEAVAVGSPAAETKQDAGFEMDNHASGLLQVLCPVAHACQPGGNPTAPRCESQGPGY